MDFTIEGLKAWLADVVWQEEQDIDAYAGGAKVCFCCSLKNPEDTEIEYHLAGVVTTLSDGKQYCVSDYMRSNWVPRKIAVNGTLAPREVKTIFLLGTGPYTMSERVSAGTPGAVWVGEKWEIGITEGECVPRSDPPLMSTLTPVYDKEGNYQSCAIDRNYNPSDSEEVCKQKDPNKYIPIYDKAGNYIGCGSGGWWLTTEHIAGVAAGSNVGDRRDVRLPIVAGETYSFQVWDLRQDWADMGLSADRTVGVDWMQELLRTGQWKIVGDRVYGLCYCVLNNPLGSPLGIKLDAVTEVPQTYTAEAGTMPELPPEPTPEPPVSGKKIGLIIAGIIGIIGGAVTVRAIVKALKKKRR